MVIWLKGKFHCCNRPLLNWVCENFFSVRYSTFSWFFQYRLICYFFRSEKGDYRMVGNLHLFMKAEPIKQIAKGTNWLTFFRPNFKCIFYLRCFVFWFKYSLVWSRWSNCQKSRLGQLMARHQIGYKPILNQYWLGSLTRIFGTRSQCVEQRNHDLQRCWHLLL